MLSLRRKARKGKDIIQPIFLVCITSLREGNY